MSTSYYNSQQAKQSQMSNEMVNKDTRNATVMTSTHEMSTFDKSYQQATTFDSGKAIPVMLQEVYPGDIYDISIDCTIRLSAPVSNPLMNINYDINFFFVPFKQLDSRFNEVMGENKDYGYSNDMLPLPKIDDCDFKYTENDLGNYFNIPINRYIDLDSSNRTTINNIYPFLAYGKIWNDWYRDQNLQSSIDITSCYKSQFRKLAYSDWEREKNSGFLATIKYGKDLAPTGKLPMVFTNCLPYQQKGEPIIINDLDIDSLYVTNQNGPLPGTYFTPVWYDNSNRPINSSDGSNHVLSTEGNKTYDYTLNGSTSRNSNPRQANLALGVKRHTLGKPFDINDLRLSIVSQHLLENFALCGSRYVEQLSSIWGIEVDPLEIGRTELIGGYNGSLVYNNVLQTSQTSTNNFLGKLGTNLFNSIDNGKIEYAASQHGYIIGIVTCRTPINNGGQGLPNVFTQKDRLDFFNPMFNGIGEQPMKLRELFLSNNQHNNNEIFGYNEPFVWTKYNLDNANGYFSLNSATSLFPTMLFGEKYSDDNPPKLNGEWIKFNPNIIGNTLYNVSSNTKEFYHQFIAIFNFTIKYTTQQPLFNSPRVDYV